MSVLKGIRPHVRPVEVQPVETENGTAYAVSDPFGIAPNSLIVTMGALMVIDEFDGTATIPDVIDRIKAATGYAIPIEQIEGLVAMLDEGLFLFGQRFQEAYDAVVAEFESLPTRPAVLAGSAYPEDPTELRAFLDAVLQRDGTSAHPGTEPPAAVVVPHIDLQRGGPGFAAAYGEIARSDADTFVILGIAHQGDAFPFNLTDKDFDTPLGTVPTDHAFVKQLRERSPAGAFGSELPHRNEHSIEFQALLLRHVFPDRDISIVPILCGSLHGSLIEDTPPLERPEVRGFVDALRDVVSQSDRRVCVIASVDLSHVGRRFGDDRGPDDGVLGWIDTEDRGLLDVLAKADSEEFFRALAKDDNMRNVCGYPALYTMLGVFGKDIRGTLLDYRQSVEEETDSVVTFASMRFERTPDSAA